MARSARRPLSLLCAIAIMLLTGGCEMAAGMFARLFGSPAQPPAAAVRPAPAPQRAERVVVLKS